jgi:hypothetical protein
MDPWIADARHRYRAANAGALRWMLDRPRLHGAFLNTKTNPLTLADYTDADGWRGPAFTYGWIQGRGLEALVRHARHFAGHDPALAVRLNAAAGPLAEALDRLVRRDGRASFAWHGPGLDPVRPGPDGAPVRQDGPADIVTFSDIFVAKGQLAAAAALDPAAVPARRTALLAIGEGIARGRFQIDEKAALSNATIDAQPREYGPRMIFLGATGLLRALGLDDGGFGRRFVDEVLAAHARPDGALADEPGGRIGNPGHAIEFVGFALETLGDRADDALVARLSAAFHAAWDAGWSPPGLTLKADLDARRPVTPIRPWWPLPETIRAAALLWTRTRDPRTLAVWKAADAAFFGSYWRGEPPIAYQTRDDGGPMDFVPATPDLDPGYHTGLSLLGAIEAVG